MSRPVDIVGKWYEDDCVMQMILFTYKHANNFLKMFDTIFDKQEHYFEGIRETYLDFFHNG